MRGKFLWLQPRHHDPLFQNVIDRLRIKSALGDIAPAINRPKHASLVNSCRFKPGIQGIDGRAGEIDDFIIFCTTGFGASEVDGQRGEGRTIFNWDGLFPGSVDLSSNWRSRCDGDRRRQKRPSGLPGHAGHVGYRSDRWQAVGKEHRR